MYLWVSEGGRGPHHKRVAQPASVQGEASAHREGCAEPLGPSQLETQLSPHAETQLGLYTTYIREQHPFKVRVAAKSPEECRSQRIQKKNL